MISAWVRIYLYELLRMQLEQIFYNFRTFVLKESKLSNTRDKILAGALDLFNEKGCMNTSTRHIANKLGISVGNLYYHFKNKEEIIFGIYEEFMNSLTKQFTTLKDDVDMPFDSYSFLKEKMNLEKKYKFFRLENGNLYTTYPKIRYALEINMEKNQESIKKLYLHQMKYGYIVELDELELEFICSNTWILNSQWEIFWIIRKVENEKLRTLKGKLNFLYFIKRYVTKKSLENSTLLKSIEYIKKEIKRESK